MGWAELRRDKVSLLTVSRNRNQITTQIELRVQLNLSGINYEDNIFVLIILGLNKTKMDILQELQNSGFSTALKAMC